jgi:hypothetical protein
MKTRTKNVTKCRYADQYKGKREPSCGCFVCETKWRIAELERANAKLTDKLQEAIGANRYATSCANAALYVANLKK